MSIDPLPTEKPVDNTVTLSLDRAKLERLCVLCFGVSMSAVVRHLISIALAEAESRPPLMNAKFRARLMRPAATKKRSKPKQVA